MLPSCMTIRINLSSARMSYTDISPDEKPMPITSMAGERASAVMAVDAVLDGEVNNDAAGNVWMRVLSESQRMSLRAYAAFTKILTGYGYSTTAYCLGCSQLTPC